jgi:hypothetical protein
VVQAAGDEPPPPPPEPQPSAAEERARIEKVIDNLDERLAAGEISESTYERLCAKWERKLSSLED